MPDSNASSSATDTGVRVVLVTFPTVEVARQVGAQMVGQRLAACVNLIPGIESIYQWKGEIQRDPEVLAVFKTSVGCLADLQEQVQRLHPYDVPEFLALPVARGLPAYLEWVLAETGAVAG